jgi:DNA-binding NarL/FixJ family response regulator
MLGTVTRRPETTNPEPGGPDAARRRAHEPLHVLLLSARRGHREAIAQRLGPGFDVAQAAEGGAELRGLVRGSCDVAVLDADGRSLRTILDALVLIQQMAPQVPVVIARGQPDVDLVTQAMRAGAADVVAAHENLAERAREAAAALARRRAERGADQRRLKRLREAYRSVHRSRQELLGQMGSLCKDLAESYRDLSGRMQHVAMASELSALLRQELDLESLLRTTLEFALRRAGSMNAAIFLPNSTGDYTLGAYVNYDCDRDAAESMLDHLADVAAPAFEDRDSAVLMRNFSEITAALGRETDWLGDSTMVALSCRRDGECLAVMVFFRDRRTPFADATVSSLSVIADAFGSQLSRVIRTHHRHLPKDQWRGPGDTGMGPDDIDLAA